MSQAAVKTADCCRGCGKAIAPLPEPDNWCTLCRYSRPTRRPRRTASEFEVALGETPAPDANGQDLEDLEPDGDPDPEAGAPGQDPAGAVRAGREQAIGELIGFLLGDEAPAAEVGARVLALAYALRLPGAPETQRALARRCGLGLATANKLCRQNAGLFAYFAGRPEQGRP
ncbi:MAG: hypothetical protein HS113_20590 [Verrucomicrobiales bacterium]|nr:hypothetical protein [Verrucomicrobiales bacterium]